MKRIVMGSLAAATSVLAGCAGAPAPETPQPDTVSAVTETVTAQPGTSAATPQAQSSAAPASEAEQSAQNADPKNAGAKSAEPKRGVPGAPLAYPGAGGPVPANARPVKSVKKYSAGGPEFAVFKAPSGNIGCMMNLDSPQMFDCGVQSLMESGKLGIGEYGGPNWMAEILHGTVREQSDPPLYFDEVWPAGSTPAEVVQYGEVVQHGPFVCAVEETGVTCWDSESGKGAWLERDHIVFF